MYQYINVSPSHIFLWSTLLQPRVAERHFLDMRKKYGNVIAVDLVNKVDQYAENYMCVCV